MLAVSIGLVQAAAIIFASPFFLSFLVPYSFSWLYFLGLRRYRAQSVHGNYYNFDSCSKYMCTPFLWDADSALICFCLVLTSPENE